MVNILPPDSLNAARRFCWSRVITAGSLVAIVCGIIVLLALVSAYAIAGGIPAGTASFPESTLPLSYEEDQADLIRAEAVLKELAPLASTSSAVKFIAAALLVRPTGILVQNIRLTRGNPMTLILSGAAASRDDINMYRSALSKDANFKSVSVPIGILAGTKDNRFTITLTGDF